MSYEIYKSIKQLNDGTFQVVCASSNVYPKYWSNYHMTYFKDTWPTATNEEQKALWELYSTGSGDRFYPANWKHNQTLAAKFMKEKGYDWWVHSKDEALWLQYAQEFIEYKKVSTYKKRKFVVSMMFGGTREYVKKKSSRHTWPAWNKADAKVYTAVDEQDILNMFRGYDQYQVQVEEI